MAYFRRGFSILAVGWLLYLIEPLSGTGLAFPFFMVTFAITLLFAIVSLAFVLRRRPVRPLGILAWLLYPLGASALLLLFLFSQAPANPLFRLRFQLSRPALDHAAMAVRSQKSLATPRWTGLFPVRRIDTDQAEVRFISDGCGVIDECGLVYIPEAPPVGRSKTRVKHLDGPWYHLYAVF